MAKPFSGPPALALATLLVMATVALLAVMPPGASMGLAVVAAVSWCIWLDRHPTS